MTYDFRKFIEKIEKATINIKDNAIEIVNIFEKVISNDATKKKKISLLLRFKLRKQNVIIDEKKITSICDNYEKNCQNQQCRQHKKL